MGSSITHTLQRDPIGGVCRMHKVRRCWDTRPVRRGLSSGTRVPGMGSEHSGPRPEARGPRLQRGLRNRCHAPPGAGPWAPVPRPRFSQPRRRCQGDRRRTFPRRAPPPVQSDRRSPEPRFSLFRSHFRPRTGGSAASAEGPSAGGLWDGVGPGRCREGARPLTGGREPRQAVRKLPDGRGERRRRLIGASLAVWSPAAAAARF